MGIRTSTNLLILAAWACLAAACAKGTEISPTEVVILQPRTTAGVDAGADAAVGPTGASEAANGAPLDEAEPEPTDDAPADPDTGY